MATTITTATALDLTHPAQVVRDRQVDGLGHRAECGCGWVSDWTDNPADAEAAGVDHREVAAGPGDSQGRRYRTVRRDFGRVTLHAFHRLPETSERAS